mmetsp:Transcript_21939/g.62482  ORF Transcript_21939/g.62482 Transcript_21939/m.62482 type:complete len:231 (+) Transcript_21939:357-1049(+)|eukprot:CAMPEP_0119570888 /NCGR_PEP_ID=MMETSP1352-20130426/43841_1 /TAXON_ID=265584 /ORGANISM="Stauroneis constricta, Strain CCMP1120" /LENGTH=230 /DNA_ID=CAMNT_0007620565 /DNA_START=497 /DNA_END=1189 /DNA_ORIENTATION=+
MTNAKIIAGFLKKVAVTTAKGATITLGSTVASCVLAMHIESASHKFLYHYFPHKYANVEYAFGLTQRQLDAAHIRFGQNSSVNENEQHGAIATPLSSPIQGFADVFASNTNDNGNDHYHAATLSTPITMMNQHQHFNHNLDLHGQSSLSSASHSSMEDDNVFREHAAQSTQTIVTYDLRPRSQATATATNTATNTYANTNANTMKAQRHKTNRLEFNFGRHDLIACSMTG